MRPPPLLQHHGALFHTLDSAGECGLPIHRARRHDFREPPGKPPVIRFVTQRPIEPGRRNLERILLIEGRLVELATTDAIFTRPENPYTRRLIGAVPVVSSEEAALRDHIMEQENGNA